MPWIVVFTFLATLGVCGALVYAFVQSGSGEIAERLSRLWHFGGKKTEQSFPEKQKERVEKALSKVGNLVPPSTQSVNRTQ